MMILLLGAGCDAEASSSKKDDGGTVPVTCFGSKAPGEAKAVGDIVFYDGSATPYTSELTLTDEQKAAAIAVIFYSGTGLNDDDDTTTVRTLGLGLTHCDWDGSTGLAWCTTQANAWNTTISSILYNHYDDAYNVVAEGDRNGSNNFAQIGACLTVNGSADDTDDLSKYPAFEFAENYSSYASNLESFADGWYLPSAAEAFAIWQNDSNFHILDPNPSELMFDLDGALRLCGADAIITLDEDGDTVGVASIWTSSQKYDEYPDAEEAMYMEFSHGDLYSRDKDQDSCMVYAIREF